jgi:hypothetical protein
MPAPRPPALVLVLLTLALPGACAAPKGGGAPLSDSGGGGGIGGDGTDGGASDGGGTDGGSADGGGTDGGGTEGGDGGGGLLDDAGALLALETATAGLWYTSESDYPLEVVLLPDPGVALSADTATTALAPVYSHREGTLPLEARAVDEVTLAAVFDRYTVEADGWDDAMRADAERWRALRAVFEEQLGGARAFRLGERSSTGDLLGDIDIFVLGQTSSGAWAGIRTVSIET